MFAAIAPFAAEQYGVFERSQALGVGIARGTLDDWIRTKRVDVLHAGVYGIPGTPPSFERSVIAAVLAAGPGAVASHRTAGRLHGWVSDERIELAVARTRLPRVHGALVHRSGDLSPRWTTRILGIPVTTPARTLADLGAVVPPARVADALERAVIARQVTVEYMEATYDRLKRQGRNGTGVLRSVLADRALGGQRPDSMLEVYFGRLIRDHDLPMPEFQYEIWHNGLLVARADCAYVDRKVDLEVDGWAYHSSPDAMQRGFDRDDDLDAIGWTVKHFSWRDVVLQPSKVAARLHRLLGSENPVSREKRAEMGREALRGRGLGRTGW